MKAPGGPCFVRFNVPITCLALALILLLTLSTPIAATAATAASAFDRETLSLLEQRKARQIQDAQSSTVFRDFKFDNRLNASRISFVHVTVDDAGRDYKPIHYDHGNGLAAADVDGDGLIDLYFTTQLGGNQLWRNTGRGRFENITDPAGVGLPDSISTAASFADVDNDGDPDLYVTTVRFGNHLFENLGDGRFRDVTAASGLNYSGHSSGAVFFDYNRDGRLDLFLVNVGRYTTDQRGRGGYYVGTASGFVGHLNPELAESSLLYRNLGGLKFQEVSNETGLRDSSWSGDATFADVNGDGYQDLYVLNMQGDDHYYENVDGVRFVDKTAERFSKTPWGTMGAKFFDFNRDGRLDLLLTDMHSDMTPQQDKDTRLDRLDLEKSRSDTYCIAEFSEAYLQGASNNVFGNAFFVNRGDGRFEERAGPLGLETYWPWGVSVGDLNADGFEDVFVAAGMGYPFRYGINSALLNDAGQRFVDAEFLLNIEPRIDGRFSRRWFALDCSGTDKDHPKCLGRTGQVLVGGTLSSRSSVIVDLDNDGDLDIVTSDFNDAPQVLVSNLTRQRTVHHLKIRLTGSASNRDGLGALVRVTAGGATQTQSHDGKSGYLSQSSLPLYFGLGDAQTADKVEVLWPSGQRQSVTQNIPVNGLLTITED